jgi:tetratricopeptide (TPR) repeat protein
MPHKKLSRNAPCPCDSGKKYKHCCWNKGFEWVEDEDGTVYKSTPMSPEVREVLEQQRQAFVAKYGREPGPGDLLFPDMPHPEHLEAMMVEDMKAAGLNPAFIYAFETTGLLVTEQNKHLIPDEDLAEWDAAIEEYDAKHGRERPANLPNRRAMEGMLQQLITGLPGQADHDTPLDKAQALIFRAFEEADEQRRVQLAKDALTICPDCADAYVLLAEHAASRKQSLDYYEKGTAAGERTLGADAFHQNVGHFWSILETRPYMRARLGLAHSLWTCGRRDEAVWHLQDMLRLNPGDNQGVRYTLAGFLLFLDRDDDLEQLLQQYPDEDCAAWAYTKALLAFRRHGDTTEVRQLLQDARKTNKYVPAYLLGEKFPPNEKPNYYSPGDENEALNYMGGFMAGWKATAGAVAWLRENVASKKEKQGPSPKGPLGFIKKWLNKNLPQEYDVWQADFRRMPNWIRVGGKPMRPWVVLATSRSNDLVLAHEMPEETPSAALLWDTLVQAMQHPAAGEPHRPTELQVRPDERWDALKPHLDEIGVGLTVAEELDQMEVVFTDMSAHICGKPKPGLLEMPAITPEQVGGFYEAAASFFRQAPWKKVGYEAAMRVECGKFQSGPWYAVLMGQSGLTTGLALYEDLPALRRRWAGDFDNEEFARQTVGTSLTFGEEWDIPVADLEAAQKYGWQVARPDAYPEVFRKERGLSMRPPLAWELELMEGCLRAVPDFVKRRSQDDPGREEFTVPAASSELKLVLSWVVEEEGGENV